MQYKIFIHQFAEVKTVFSPLSLQSFGLSTACQCSCLGVAQGELYRVSGGWQRALLGAPGCWEEPGAGEAGPGAIAPGCCWVMGVRCGSRALPARVQRAAELGYEPASLWLDTTPWAWVPPGFSWGDACRVAPGTKGYKAESSCRLRWW